MSEYKIALIRGKRCRVRVATSDVLEQIIVLGHGCLRISARSFEEELPEVARHQVGFSQIDCNGHMGNQYYADLISDYAPETLKGQSVQKALSAPIWSGAPSWAPCIWSSGAWTGRSCRENGRCFCCPE